MIKTIEPADRIHRLMDALNMNIRIFAKGLNEKPATIYQITSGRNNISSRLAKKIKEHHPNVNMEFLIKGTGTPLLSIKDILNKEESTSLDEEILKRVVFLETKITRLESNLQTIAGLLRDMIEVQNQKK